MLSTKLFIGEEKTLVVYNGQPLINHVFDYSEIDICDGETIPFDFPEFTGAYFRIFNERLGKELFEMTLTLNGSTLIGSTEAIILDDNGPYYYEILYIQNVYEIVLSYGTLKVI